MKILVLDALNGKPQAGVEVNEDCMSSRSREIESVTTDAAGIAEFAYPCVDKEILVIDVLAPRPKEQCGGPVAFTMKEISEGVVTKPDAAGGIWCPTKVSNKLKPVPGQVIIFVKKPTWYQSHVAG